jgi:hypothetical protein
MDQDRDMGAHGRFDRRATSHSLQLWMNLNRNWLALAGAGAAIALGAVLAGRKATSRRSSSWIPEFDGHKPATRLRDFAQGVETMVRSHT